MTQENWILGALKKRKTGITAIDALTGCGCFRLAARISDLRKQGHPIITESISAGGKVFARYKYIKKEK
jgi:hypothetical protein